MLSRFFIDRPIFATVLSVVITLVGGIALYNLPIAQYPRISPPGVAVSISYPGANAQTVADTVGAPIEQQVNGIDGMLYMSSQSGNDGSYTLSVTFDVGVDLNTALVMVQNRVALAMPLLPTPVQNQGITIRKKTPDILLIINFYATEPRYDDLYLSNFALINVKDEILRVEGVSDVSILGERDYSIRAWLDPQKLASLGMTAGDVVAAVRSQNMEAALGSVGQAPAVPSRDFQLPLDALGRLTQPEQFGDIIVKVGTGRPITTKQAAAPARHATAAAASLTPLKIQLPNPLTTTTSDSTGTTTSNGSTTGGTTTGGTTDSSSTTTGGTTTGGAATPGTNLTDLAINTPADSGATGTGVPGGPRPPAPAIVRLKDVADVELGAQNYNQACTFDGKPSVGVGVYQLPGTNALNVADSVRAKMKELQKRFPEGVHYTIGYDTTPFIRESIDEVFHTLRDAVILVAIVVLFFLQDWKAMILPMIDVPVSLIGTFAVMAVMGYSLNNISLFGLVLAIGIVVDDAIVVLENIERQMARGYDTRTATIKAMEEISGPIMAITLVLCAVFVPCAFISGITGRFFRQFAVTIAASTVISAINALTMTPSRAIVIFKTEEVGHGQGQGHAPKRDALPWWFFGLLGGVVTVWLARTYLHAFLVDQLGLPDPAPVPEDDDAVPAWLGWAIAAGYFTPGLLVGLALGWMIIRSVNVVLGAIFRAFNRAFDAMTALYGVTVGAGLRLSVVVLVIYAGLLALTVEQFQAAPTGFVPQQDMGRLIVSVQLPDSASVERTKVAMEQVDQITRDTPGVAHTIGIAGISFVQQANGSNFGSLFVILEPFSKRQDKRLSDKAIIARLSKEWDQKVRDAKVVAAGASPIPGLSVAGGFKIIVEDRGSINLATLQDQTDKLIAKMGGTYRLTDDSLAAAKAAGVPDDTLEKLEPLRDRLLTHPQFRAELAKALSPEEVRRYEAPLSKAVRQPGLGVDRVTTSFRSGIPQLYLDIDRDKVASLGVSLDDVNQALQVYQGSLYVNSFNEFGRHWQVTLQSQGKFRAQPEAINLLTVRNKAGQPVLLGTLAELREKNGPIFVQRYNLYTAAAVTGNLAPGVSSGDVISKVERLADESLPRSMKAEWTELMFLQINEGNTAPVVFGLAVICVFLALAALYESWTLPLAVILVVPMCVLSSVLGVLHLPTSSDRSVNIFVLIGLVVLLGLACKNAILVVEFAKQLHDEGKSRFEATLEASRLRLRPILMTSFAFILGVLPLVIASGAGAEMRRSLGTAVFSGMVGVTLFGIFLTPVFFYVIQGLGESRLFASVGVQRVFSWTLGGLVGMATGYLLAELGVVELAWALPVGAATGGLVVAAVLGVHERWRRPTP
jgi:multidrug efflux pump